LSLEVITFFALAGLTYALKFFWAPLVDRTPIPGLTRLLGHRRSWMLVTQAVIIFGLWSIAGLNPSTALASVAGFAVLVGLFGATQDIVIDAWRIEAADDSRQGAMAAAYQWGYRIAVIVAGAVPLLLAEAYSWNVSYAVMAALMGIGVAGVLLAPRERKHVVRPIPVGDTPSRPAQDTLEWGLRLALIAVAALIVGTGLTAAPDLLASLLGWVGFPAANVEAFTTAFTAKPGGAFWQVGAVALGLGLLVLACWPLPGRKTRPGAYMAGSFGTPLADFYRRFSGTATLILALICLYRLADFVLNLMNPFYADLGFTKVEIAEVRKVFGVVASMAGVFVGGWSVAKLGLIRTMVIGAFASPLSNLVFAWLAVQGAGAVGAVHRHRRRQRGDRLRGNGADRIYEQPDERRLHRHAVCAVLLALCLARQAHRLAVGTHCRGFGAARRSGRALRGAQGAVRRPAAYVLRRGSGDRGCDARRARRGLRGVLSVLDAAWGGGHRARVHRSRPGAQAARARAGGRGRPGLTQPH
jgi:PAT family beta-lactamase induction signal transducer AmpG